ncbi:MAG TPA: tetratricopeptide repeat protein [Bryobacteraceae bacterium]|nr:tetratricopeptide repeat protein [Bryobacteraceae bacterium]
MTAERKSILQAALIAPVVYWLCLRLLFPGYFHPLFPPHPDLCMPAGLQIRPIAEIFTYPRPASFLFWLSFGWMGVHASILIGILMTGAGLLCMIWLVQSWTKRSASPLAIACYAIILFAQPQFYFQHRQDLSSSQSFITCLLAVEFWRRWVTNRKPWEYFAFAGCLALTVLTKETYVGSLAILLCGATLTLEKPNIRQAIAGLAGGLLVVAGCEAINLRGYDQWVLPVLGKDPAYRMTSDVRLIAKTALGFLSDSLTWPAILILLLVLALLWRERKILVVAISFVAAGIAAILPNSLLPNHAIALYAWSAVPLLFAPVLILPRRGLAMAPLLVLTCLWVWTNRVAYRSAGEQWEVAQEKVNERVLQSFAKIKHSDNGAYRLLVSGLNAPLSPWGYEDFVRVALGDHKWTLLVLAESADRTGKYLSTRHIAEVNPANYDGVVEYGPDGNMLRALTGPAYFAAIRNDPEQVLVPELGKNPNDFASLLKAGTVLLDWGDVDRAQSYLEQAVRASNGANPYPFFFLGQCAERKHDRAAALGYYEKAVRADAEPRNPFFQQSVDRLTTRP